MTDKNKDPVFAWRLNEEDEKQDESTLYAYRREGWMYIFICLALRRPLPPLCLISRKFPHKIKEVKNKKETAQFVQGVLLGFISIPICVHFNISTLAWFYIFLLVIGAPMWIPMIAVFVFKRLDRLREKIKHSSSHTPT